MSRRRVVMVFALAMGAACGGGSPAATDSASGSDASRDALVVQDAPIDAMPVCAPAVPAATVFAAGSAGNLAGTQEFALMSSGEAALIYVDSTSGYFTAHTWDGSAWGDHTVLGMALSSFYGNAAVGEMSGRPVFLAEINSSTLRDWPQLATGAFATGTSIPSLTGNAGANRTRYNPTTSVLSVAADDVGSDVYSLELTSTGTWTVGTVHTGSANTVNRAVGLGALTDNTSIVAVTTTVASGTGSGFELYRRTGSTWAAYKSLFSGGLAGGWVQFPPVGATGGSAIAVYVDGTTGIPYGMFFSTTDATAGGAAELLTSAVSLAYAEVVYAPDGTSGKILLVDGSTNPKAWIVPFQGTSFTAAEELRPDLVFDAGPHLVYHPCGGFMIEHTSRAPTDNHDSEPVMFEPLATFAPGV